MGLASTWTRKVAAPMVAAAVAVACLAASGSAAAATSNGLTVHQARHLAHKLVVKQRRERSLVFTHLGRPHRRSSNRIDFRYADRSTDDVLCNARIVVKQTSGHRNAELVGAKCHGIPSDVLGYEGVTRHLSKALPDLANKVRKSLDRYERSTARCDYVAVPKNRAKDVDLLMDVGFTYAFYHPLRARLGTFADDLHDVHAGDPKLVSGLKSWDNILIVFDELDPATHDPCAAVKEWAANDWSDEAAPADFGKLRVERDQFNEETVNLDRAAKYLARAGVVRRTAVLFSPQGLLDFFTRGSSGAPGAG